MSKILSAAFLLVVKICLSQNLVSNGDFETYTSCPIGEDELFKAYPWFNSTTGTPDYFNSCASGDIDVPYNGPGFQIAHSGNGYAGIYAFQYNGVLPNIREYLSVPLKQSLQAGKNYLLKFYVSLANRVDHAVTTIGAYFSINNSLPVNGYLANVSPQIVNSIQLLADTVNWTVISGIYKASGNEGYLHIGNFANDSSSGLQQVGNSLWYAAYYYIDDVLLYDPNNIEIYGDSSMCLGDSITLFALGSSSCTWASSSSPSTIISSNTSITIAPSVTTTYFLYGSSDTTSFTVNVNYPPSFNLGNDTVVCPGKSVTIDASSPNATYLWSNGQTTSTITSSNPGMYTVIVTDMNGCSQKDSIKIVNINAIANAGVDVTILAGDSTQLNASGGISYVWSPSDGLNCISCVNPVASPLVTTIYCVSVTSANGCAAMDCMEVEVECGSGLYIPNAFSPNADGENDSLQIYYRIMDCIESLHLIIYDRWGQSIYETNDPHFRWEGKVDKRSVGTQVVAYSLYVRFTDGKDISRRGNISLVR